jgi:hypothetical protein
LDIFATIIYQTKKAITPKNQLDGVNLLPYITGKKKGSPHDFLFWRKFDKSNYAVRNASGDKIIGLEEKINLFNLNDNISEDPELNKENPKLAEELKTLYDKWNAQMLDPVFLGLGSDQIYNENHPNRFKNPK